MKYRISLLVAALATTSFLGAIQFPLFSHNYRRAFVRMDANPSHYCVVDESGLIRGYENDACRLALAEYVDLNNLSFVTMEPDLFYSCSYTPQHAFVKREGDGMVISLSYDRASGKRFATKMLYDITDGRKYYHGHATIALDEGSPELADTLAKLDAYIEANDL